MGLRSGSRTMVFEAVGKWLHFLFSGSWFYYLVDLLTGLEGLGRKTRSVQLGHTVKRKILSIETLGKGGLMRLTWTLWTFFILLGIGCHNISINSFEDLMNREALVIWAVQRLFRCHACGLSYSNLEHNKWPADRLWITKSTNSDLFGTRLHWLDAHLWKISWVCFLYECHICILYKGPKSFEICVY